MPLVYDTPDQVLSYSQRRAITLANLEEQLKLSTSPRGRIDLLSQVLMIKMDLEHLATSKAHLREVQGMEIRL